MSCTSSLRDYCSKSITEGRNRKSKRGEFSVKEYMYIKERVDRDR